jgi:hypothetical protein
MTKEENLNNVYRFVATQIVSNEYYSFIKDYLIEEHELYLSTKYKHRFVANRQNKRKIEKSMQEERKQFKMMVDKYDKITTSMVKSLDTFKSEKNEVMIDDIYKALE